MSDKYEEMARQYTRDRHGEHTGIASNVADAFRWFDAEREKETCETCEHRHLEPRVNQGKDEFTNWCLNDESEMFDVQILHKGFGCNKHSRRIEEVKG